MVTFHTNHGDIVIKTFDDKAPETVKNFLDYCREGFYNNTIFHRVINGFMIQGGGFEPGMKQKATKECCMSVEPMCYCGRHGPLLCAAVV